MRLAITPHTVRWEPHSSLFPTTFSRVDALKTRGLVFSEIGLQKSKSTFLPHFFANENRGSGKVAHFQHRFFLNENRPEC